MKRALLILVINIIICQDYYEELMNGTVTEEYCGNVIGNITEIINEGYIYSDYLKAPTQRNSSYFTKVDLIKELNNINKINRSFYEFYGDIIETIGKTGDGHLAFVFSEDSNIFPLNLYYFCIPFKFYVYEEYDEDNNTINDTYLTIKEDGTCLGKNSEEIISKSGKRIISINDLEPFDYLEKMNKYIASVHSRQGKYIISLRYMQNGQLNVIYYPFKKQNLSISIKFEGEDELFETEFKLQKREFFSEEFKEFYLKEQKIFFQNRIPLPKFNEIENKFKIQKGLINKLKEDEEDIWDLKNSEGTIKCRVDEENKFNVLLQKSFNSEKNFSDYENIMYECFSKFYSNDYKIIIIEAQNGGGYSELCYPFTKYVYPKNSKPLFSSMKSTQLNLRNFFINDENVNPETCFPYTEKDDILNGSEDIYDDGENHVIHKRSKYIEDLNIFEKKIMEKKRKEYLATGKTKNSTDILIFTDGFSFSCTSFFIKNLQVSGAGIIVGYQARPDIDKFDFDASQSNSGVETFDISENVQNLKKLGFESQITFREEFDPNDKENPRIPMEFLKYPVDEISTIYTEYDDKKYERFINEAKRIFEKYNENGECNPNNTFLYYEADECDSIININNAHGGYVCGTDGKWDKKKCIAAYCNDGYYLNDERTECIKDPCENIKLNEITINSENETKFIIEPNNIYIFTLDKENYSYNFYSEFEPFIYALNEEHILKPMENGTLFKNQDKVYINFYVNITENTSIIIKPEENDTSSEDASDISSDESSNNSTINRIYPSKKKDKGLSTGIIVLIIVLLIILLIIVLVMALIFRKKNFISNNHIGSKSDLNILSK